MTKHHALKVDAVDLDSTKWAALTHHPETTMEYDAGGERRVAFCYFLGMLVQGATATAEQLARFKSVLEGVIDADIVRGRLTEEALFLPLRVLDDGKPRGALFAYVHVYIPGVVGEDVIEATRARLNKGLGFDGFVTEGSLPNEWPAA